MTDTLLVEALGALKTKIKALADLDAATAEDIALLGTAFERIAGKATAVEIQQAGEAQQAAITSEATTARDNALQAIADAVAAADTAIAAQLQAITDAGTSAIPPITQAQNDALAAIQAERTGGSFNGLVTFNDQIVTNSVVEGFAPVTSAAGVAQIECAAANVFLLELTEDTAIELLNPPPSGQAFGLTLEIVQDASPRVVTWPASVKFPNGGVAPEASSTAGAIDVFTLTTRDGGASWLGALVGQDFA